MRAFKKSISASLVCAGTILVAANSHAHELYGDLRLSVNDIDLDGSASDTQSFDNNNSRIGIKGSYDLGDGNSAFYHIEYGYNTADSGKAVFTQRFGMAGLSGGWGKAMFGTASSPYKMAGLTMDPFYDTAAGQGIAGASYGLSGFTNGWFDNVVAYVSPAMNGVTANFMAMVDDTPGNDHSYNPGISWSGGGFGVNVQLLQVNAAVPASELDATRVALTYKADAFSVGVSLENVDPYGNSDSDYMYVAGTYHVTDKTKVSASYGSVSDNNGGDGKGTAGDGITLGVFHNLHKMTQVYGLISSVDADVNANDRDTISIGLSQKFGIGG